MVCCSDYEILAMTSYTYHASKKINKKTLISIPSPGCLSDGMDYINNDTGEGRGCWVERDHIDI